MQFLNAISSSVPLLASATETVDSSMVMAAVLLSLVVIYFASKVGGELSNRVGLPPVLGELVGGVVVGISVLHLLVFPEGGTDSSSSLIIAFLQSTAGLTPQAADGVFAAQSEVISVLAELGVIVLLFEIGLESNLKDLMAVGIQATIVAVVGVVAPFAAGTVGLMTLFGIDAVPAIFAGAALTATSIGITSKVLSEIGRLNSKEGQIILGAAVIDDVLGIIVLAVVASLAKDGEVDVTKVIFLIISATTFLLGAILLGNFFNKSFVSIVNRLKTRGELVIPAFIFAFVMAYLAAVIQLEAILGAFAAGLVLEETDKRKELQKQVIPIADMLVPIFFVTVGAKTDLGVLNPAIPTNREGLIMASFLIIVAIIGKVITGLTVFGQPEINRLAIGVGMIPRGEVGLVFAGVGAASGALSKPLGAAIIMMVILTTFLAPPLLRFVFPDPASETTDTETLVLDGAGATSLTIEEPQLMTAQSPDVANLESAPDSSET
ncbi:MULTISPECIES: cation:proton antiporter [unclassified Tolypothrix]|uniref:cation:proton antiporter n=1 Tax=unclassified Tolypothrix TaxID=2649714 RepID=UPI0005EAC79A|nr:MULTISPECIES: cation:proton antiporter [unclassified Tolypothrix]BAY91827.1 Na+/H+-exchanging protein [Microchaete diplosiphon NIES-3275]EKF05019.1 transporter, monovalent cation:proton antiporter-2 family protein [Tolypothrix sp. PCC 7601]MBE9081235.1 cation:proton antiporter [Tolypothrix sp. LEGE 11397]UYD25837.1 cation:proton antiporter [Tolypothrix sp. PCC 7712]UYD31923.1 cation:proton antiporter [Tolypothrix sp. PCC 7601]